MKHNETDLLFAVRSLNHWRPLFSPTYLGLRFLLDSTLGKESHWLGAFVSWKFSTRLDPRYTRFQQVKGLNAEGNLEYRDFQASSPSTALAEAWALAKLSLQKEFRLPTCVYSYHWPRYKSASRSFEYYSLGYQSRNERISRLLSDNQNSVAVVTDIRQFYPSVEKKSVMDRYKKRVDKTVLTGQEKDVLIRLGSSFLRATEVGIPVGPPLSHVFGNLALENVDAQMLKVYGDRYTRYVDDIVLVVDREEEKDAKKLIESILQGEGLSTHPEKSDTLSSEEWIENVPSIPVRPRPGSFEELRLRLTSYLAIRPEKYETLRSAIIENGLKLPIQRMLVESSYGRMRRYLHVLFNRNELDVSKALFDTEESLLSACSALRDKLKNQFAEATSRPLPSRVTTRKWHIQKKKYIFNRLIYLVPESDYQSLLESIEEDQDLFEHKTLLRSLLERDIRDIVDMPGSVMSSFSSLVDPQRDLKMDWDFVPSSYQVDSLAVLALTSLVHPPSKWIERCDKRARRMMEFCLNDQAIGNDHDFTFFDEITTLRGKRKRADFGLVLNSRFSEQESVWFDALNIGDEYHYG